jgi:hypothetical protein
MESRDFYKFNLTKAQSSQRTQRKKRKIFLISQSLNQKVTEGYIGIYKLCPNLCVLRASVRDLFEFFFFQLMILGRGSEYRV